MSGVFLSYIKTKKGRDEKMATAGEIKAKLTLDNAQFRRGMQEAQTEMQNTANKSKQTSEGVSMLGKASAVAGVAIVASIGASVKAAANFEQSMAKVKAISGATDSEFKQLEATAKHLGATTQFSASQAADGLAFLSLAGFKAQDSIDAMPAVLNLAAAGAIDLGSAADIASNIMTGFGLEAKDTSKAADILAKTFTTANTDMNQLGMAMKYVAPVANALGWDMTDAATAVAKMSDAGIQGSQAGTSLRAMLLSLANPTGQTAKAFDKLGISVVNSNGQFKPLPELIGHISSKMDGMTDAQKTVTAAQLVGTEASAGFLALLEQGQGSLQDYKTELELSGGTAERVAKIQQETLVGAWNAAKSAMEGLAIGLGTTLLPAFTAVVNGATALVSGLASIDPAFLSAGLSAAAAATGLMVVSTNIGKVVGALKILQGAMKANPYVAAISLVGAAIAGLTTYVKSAKKETQELQDVNLDTYKKLGEDAKNLDELANTHDELKGKIKLSTDELLRYKDIQNEIKRTEEGDSKKKLIEEYEALGKKAGVTKEEMDKYLKANDEIISKAPATATAFDGKGNAIAKTADEARKLSDQYRQMQREELILAQSKLMMSQAKDLENYTKALEKAREVKKELPKLEKEYNTQQKESERLQAAYNSTLADSNGKMTEKAKFAGEQLEKQNKITEKAREEYREAQSATQEFNAQTLALNGKSMQYDKITKAVIEEQMAAAGVSGEMSNAVSMINDKLKGEIKNVEALEKQKEAAGGLTKEQQQSLDASNKMVDKLQDAKGSIQQAENQAKMFKDGVKAVQDQAIDMNNELEKPINKKTKGDTSDFDAKNAEADKKGSKENVKKTKGDTSDHEKKNAEADKKGSKENTKKTKGDTSDFDSKNAKADKDAQKENTKKTKGDIADVEKKNADAERQMKEEVTKNLNMNDKEAKARLAEIKKEATKTEFKDVIINIKESITRTVSNIFGNAEKRHNGGTLSQTTKRPKYHNGGSPAGLAAHRPKFDEVDARLLKNEMVLTQAQQANLFNALRTAHRPSNTSSIFDNKDDKKSENVTKNVVINVAEMNVRDDQDIEKIAQELARLERSKERARGI
ncbi:phage tail tape measure protein, TP901 family, core region [Bacillus sp. ok061]|uniref:phage tail tape measure protein n=1 Tax=Bacillus sp. ok061 TaxID=1761766 RepID=UPI00089E76A2|nr:phage tail tape measure protein [Bacillus sp. ok061]SEG49441.1 phage tail tape measure protein, TP901 family, core region [Bacillus sp. ok061]